MILLKRMRDDIKMIFGQDPAVCSTLKVITTCADLHAVWSHLIAHKLYNQRKYIAAYTISQIPRFFTSIKIHPGARIGKRLFIDYGTGVIIEEIYTIGDNVTICQSVTLDRTGRERGKGHPDIGDNVLIAAGARVLGNIKMSSNVNVDANSVILQSVSSHSTVVGIPGHIAEQDGVQVGKTFDHRHLPDPIYEQIKHLKQQLERTRNGEIQDDYII